MSDVENNRKKCKTSEGSGIINWLGNTVELLDLMDDNIKILIKNFGLIDKILTPSCGKSKVIQTHILINQIETLLSLRRWIWLFEDKIETYEKLHNRKHMDCLYEQKSLNADQPWNI